MPRRTAVYTAAAIITGNGIGGYGFSAMRAGSHVVKIAGALRLFGRRKLKIIILHAVLQNSDISHYTLRFPQSE